MEGCLAQPQCSQEGLDLASVECIRLCRLPMGGLNLLGEWVGGGREAAEGEQKEAWEGESWLVCKMNKKELK